MAAPTMNRPRPAPLQATATAGRTSRRNRTRIAIGAALMIVSAFAAAVLYSDAGERHAFLVLTHRVAAGDVIGADDLGQTLAAIDSRSAAIPAGQRDAVVGRIATVDLVPGALLAPSQLSDRAPAASADAVISARLEEGRAPADLAVGDAVLLYEVPGENEQGDVTSAPTAGRIVSIATAADGSSVIVSLAVSPADARRAAVAAARGRVTLVLAGS
jgi:hypothetical protein